MAAITNEVLEKYAREMKVRGYKRPSETTLSTYLSRAARYADWLDGKEPSVETHKEYIELILSTKSRGYALACHHTVMSIHRFLKVDVAEMSIEPGEPLLNFHTEADIIKMYKACQSPTDRAIVAVLWQTGMRAAELLALKWEDIDVVGRFVHIERRKGGKQQDVTLGGKDEYGDVAIDALKELRQERQRHGIRTAQIYPISYDQLYAAVNKIGARAHIKISPHGFRHARASDLRKSGVPLDRIQRLLGHTNPMTTSKYYAHLSPDDLRDDIDRYTSLKKGANKRTSKAP